jgi:GT2 family glycosyltransferase
LIVESGSTVTSEEICSKYSPHINVRWFMYQNDGQGFSRNYGMTQAKGDYFVILDSDVLLDSDYLESLNRHLERDYLDAYGGPDRFHDSFSDTQKAVDFAMTSPLTTGGIRGGKKHVGTFYPRSFNMGFSREVYEDTKGYKIPYFGEDIELSRRIMSLGYKTGLVPDAYVYHKRKTSLKCMYKQLFFFGRARINIYKMFPDTLKLTFFFPSVFFLYYCSIPFSFLLGNQIGLLYAAPLLLYTIILFIGAVGRYKSLKIGFLSIGAVYTQMTAYGLGFLKDFIRRVILKKENKTKNKD